MRHLAILWSRDSPQWMEEEHLRSGFSTANGVRIAHWGWYVRVHVPGALGEELGWRGFLLPLLQRKASPVISALIMSVLWSLWHSPSFFFPGLPQVFISPLAFLAMVTAFGVFLSLIFNKTRGHVFGTVLAHFVLNASLALGGARFGNVLWWSLAGTFSLLACWSGFMLSRPSSPNAGD